MTYRLQELRAFLAVVEAGSLGKAAETLSITQPALSRIVKRLETDVGEPLFERHSGGMRVTVYGKALLPHAQLLHREETIARDEIKRMRGLATGVLRIGVTAGASAYFLPKALGEFLDKWPSIAVEVVEGIWDDLTCALASYQVDLVLAPESSESAQIVSAKNCTWHEKMSVVVGAAHPLRGRSAVRMKDLAEERWCFVPQATEPHNRLSRLFETKGLRPPVMAVTSTSIPLLKSLVAYAGFVSWLTAPMYSAEVKAGMIHELHVDELDHGRRFAAYQRREGILPRPAASFLDEVRTLAAALS